MFVFQFVPDLVILYLEQSFTLLKQGTNVQHKRKTQETLLQMHELKASVKEFQQLLLSYILSN